MQKRSVHDGRNMKQKGKSWPSPFDLSNGSGAVAGISSVLIKSRGFIIAARMNPGLRVRVETLEGL